MTSQSPSAFRTFWARTWSGAAPWVVLLFAAANFMAAAWHADLLEERRKNLLLADVSATGGAGTNAAARFDVSVGEDLERFWRDIPDARRQPLVILCGMSQMYAINDRKRGDQTIVEWLDDALAPKGVRVFGLAAPNLSNEEALLLLLATVSRSETLPRAFTFGVCFDKFRNIDLRDGYQRFLRARPDLQEAWSSLAHRYAGRYPRAADKMLASWKAASTGAAGASLRPTSETRIRDAAARVFPVVDARIELNGFLQNEAYRLRNRVFRIKPTSKRPMLESRYRLNQEFLELMIDLAHERGVALPMYVVPLNPRAENPYVPEEYARSVAWLEALSRSAGVPFANLENAVPPEDWGEFMGGPDFKHFRGEGHRITAASVLNAFEPVFLAQGGGTRAAAR
jgi:hypothetical protein